MIYRYLLILALFVTVKTNAQVADYAMQLKADVQSSPAQIILSWAPITGATSYTIYRKSQGAAGWGAQLASVVAPTATYVDNSVVADAAYEYKVEKNGGTGTAYGYVFAGIKAPPIHNRGALLLLVDANFTAPCAVEIDRLMKDISGDGWQVIRKDFANTTNDVTVRNFIISTNATTPLAAVYILGHIAIPYSGEINPDGHGDHIGAWPADVYYADLNDTWTDNVVNNTTGARVETKNIPGDGKWDQSVLPGDVELQVGRVDFFDMPTFAKTEVAMMQSYLNKAHTYKMDSLAVVHRALVDDNFGVFSGEAFAANAYRNFPVLVGKDSIKTLDFIPTLNATSYQWAYGCGAGSYTSAGGIGNTNNFKTNNVNAIFTMQFGSYFGDWAATNNFLRAPMCSNDPALTACWAGRPNWFMHHMALGENIGYSTRLSQNNIGNNGGLYTPSNYGGRFVHVALMGDPTLRTDYINPPTNVVLTSTATTGATVNWTASADPAVVGYYVYRSDDRFGAYTKRSNMLTGTTFTETGGANGLKYYMVRAVQLQTSPSGSYYNLSIGNVDSEYVTYPVSVNTVAANEPGIELYPNPACNTIYLSLPGNQVAEMTIKITDLSGKTIVKKHFDKSNRAGITIGHLPSGIYHATVIAGDKTYVKQWVKATE